MVSMNDIVRAGARVAAMPASVAQVTAMLAAGVPDAAELEAIIRADEVLAAAVLRRANSACFGASGRTFDLRRSIVRLGAKPLGRVVLEQCASEALAGGDEAFGLVRGALWRSGIGGAIAAEMIAARHAPDDAGICYVGGLLRDIGKIALDAYFGGRYLPLIEAHAAQGLSFVECERRALGFDHAAVGAEMASAWGLPERLCEIIGRHHEPLGPDAGGDVGADIVHAADAVCLWAGFAVGHDGMRYAVAPHVRATVGLTRHEAEREVAHVWAAVREIEQNLNAPTAQEKSA